MRCSNSQGARHGATQGAATVRVGMNVHELTAHGEGRELIRFWYSQGVPVERIAAACGMTCRQVRRLCKVKRRGNE